MLKDFKALLEELNTTNSSVEKKSILAKYPQCKELLKWALNPFVNFYLTSKVLEDKKDLVGDINGAYINIELLLTTLSQRKLTGHSAIGFVNNFLHVNLEYRDVVYRILDRDLKCRVGADLINDVYPKLIPKFEVALAEDYFKQKNVNLDSGEWFWSRKLDGCRCITRIENGVVTFWSRQGIQFTVLEELKQPILGLKFDNTVLDGEICLIDEEGNEDFQGIMKEIRRKDHTIDLKRMSYKVFDCLTLEEFDSGTSKATLKERYNRFDSLHPAYWLTPHIIQILPQIKVQSLGGMLYLLSEASRLGWEGLILRKNVPYEGKRSKNMLKVKKMQDAEYRIEEVIPGVIDDGHGNKVEGLSAIGITHKGCKVKVGTGFSYEDRILYNANPNLIIGKVATIQYFEETKNQEGGFSLRFPVLKIIHGEQRDV